MPAPKRLQPLHRNEWVASNGGFETRRYFTDSCELFSQRSAPACYSKDINPHQEVRYGNDAPHKS